MAGPEHGTTLVTGLPLATVQGTLANVEDTQHVVYAAVLVLALALGTAMVQLSLRPLRRVAATATKVTELPLDSGEVTLPAGVPDSDPRTEVGRVGAAFNRMLFHVERALGRRAASEARLRRFAADASHELRTPLSAIRGYAELALRHPGPVPEDVTHALRRVESESARMTVLVDDLLLLARLDAGRPLEREPVDLSRLAIETTSDAQVARGDHRWRLELPDEPVLVEGDEHRLHQVLANLLSNAGKHTPPGSTVRVALTLGDATASPGCPRAPPGTAVSARRRSAGPAGGAEHHRRRSRHLGRAAARAVRAVHPRRGRASPGRQRGRQEHRPRPGHRGRGCGRPRRRHHRDQPPGHDQVRHPAPAAARTRRAAAGLPGLTVLEPPCGQMRPKGTYRDEGSNETDTRSCLSARRAPADGAGDRVRLGRSSAAGLGSPHGQAGHGGRSAGSGRQAAR